MKNIKLHPEVVTPLIVQCKCCGTKQDYVSVAFAHNLLVEFGTMANLQANFICRRHTCTPARKAQRFQMRVDKAIKSLIG